MLDKGLVPRDQILDIANLGTLILRPIRTCTNDNVLFHYILIVVQ